MDRTTTKQVLKMLRKGRFTQAEALIEKSGDDGIEAMALWGMSRVGRFDFKDQLTKLPDLEAQRRVGERGYHRCQKAADALERTGQSQSAEGLRRYLVEVAASRYGVESPETSAAYGAYLLSIFAQDLGRFEHLERGYRRLVEIEKRLEGSAAALAQSLFLLAETRVGRGDGVMSVEAPLNEAAALVEADETIPVAASVWAAQADVARAHGELARHDRLRERAEKWLQAVAASEGLTAPEAQHVMASVALGDSMLREQRFDEAEPFYVLATTLFDEPTTIQEITHVAVARRRLGACCSMQGRPAEAREHIEGALELVSESFGDIHIEVAYAHADVGTLLWEQKDYVAARPHLEKAVAACDTVFASAEPPPALMQCRTLLADAERNLDETRAQDAAWEQRRDELSAEIEVAGPEALAAAQAPDAPPLLQFLAACVAARDGRFGEALDRLIVVLEDGDKLERQRAADLVKAILIHRGTSDDEVNARRKRVLIYL